MLFHLLDIVRHRYVQVEVVVEVYDEDFVVPVRALHQGDGGRFHLFPLVAHTAAVVDDETQRDGNVFTQKGADGLLVLVLKNGEIVLVKTRDQFSFAVHNTGVQHH